MWGGAKDDWDYPISDLVKKKNLMELIFNSCGKFRWSPEGPVFHIYSPHFHAAALGIFSGLLRSVQLIKKEWGSESNGKLPHLFIPSKPATLVPEFAVEDLLLGSTAALVPEFSVKSCPWAEYSDDDENFWSIIFICTLPKPPDCDVTINWIKALLLLHHLNYMIMEEFVQGDMFSVRLS